MLFKSILGVVVVDCLAQHDLVSCTCDFFAYPHGVHSARVSTRISTR